MLGDAPWRLPRATIIRAGADDPMNDFEETPGRMCLDSMIYEEMCRRGEIRMVTSQP